MYTTQWRAMYATPFYLNVPFNLPTTAIQWCSFRHAGYCNGTIHKWSSSWLLLLLALRLSLLRLLSVGQDLHSILTIHIACTTPYRRRSHNIPITPLASTNTIPSSDHQTYCIIVNPNPISTGTTGATIIPPINPSCNAVFHLLMVVGLTSALGNEKSQYLLIVFGGGRLIHL